MKNKGLLKNGLKVMLFIIAFFVGLFVIIYPSSIPGDDSLVYESAENFEKDMNIPFYKIYSINDYVYNNNKIILGEEKDCLIICQEDSVNSYVITEDNNHSYHITYGKNGIDKDGYYRLIRDGELTIQQLYDYLWIVYSSKTISIGISFYGEVKEDDYLKIEDYIIEVLEMNDKV